MAQEGYTPKEIAKLEKSRAISDGQLLRGGAYYEVDKDGTKRLIVTKDQIDNNRGETGWNSGERPDGMSEEEFELNKKQAAKIRDIIEKKGVQPGDSVNVEISADSPILSDYEKLTRNMWRDGVVEEVTHNSITVEGEWIPFEDIEEIEASSEESEES